MKHSVFSGAQPIEQSAAQLRALTQDIRTWATELGFAGVGITDTDLRHVEQPLQDWLARGWHGEMEYMARHGERRTQPAALVPGTLRVIACRMNYLPEVADAREDDGFRALADSERACIARYARGRDYHTVLRRQLQRLATRVEETIGAFGYRVFTDSAPVMEVELARKAGLGWRGKHTLLLSRDAGSWFFLGEIYVDIPLPVDAPTQAHCGTCTRCISVCPTQAIRAPYQLDARRCISYLTIELKGSIPLEFRPLIGNRVYGCDDCQLICPWNAFAQPNPTPDFAVRHGLDAARLVDLFAWTEAEFLSRMQGSAIRRIGYVRWLRNLAVGLGNAKRSAAVVAALNARRDDPSALVREHVQWALAQHAQQ